MTKIITIRLITAIFAIIALVSGSLTVSAVSGNNDKKVTMVKKEKSLYSNTDEIKDVKLNKIGLDRVNKTRKSKGLISINSTIPDGSGSDVVFRSNIGTAASTAFAASSTILNTETDTVLPSRLDNSTDPETARFFPNIGTQKGNSCATFSLSYYIMTYMTAMQKGVSVKNNDGTNNVENVFSPKWSFTLTNLGADSGPGSLPEVLEILNQTGFATWKDFRDNVDYYKWCYQPDVWKNAINNRFDHVGQIFKYNTYEERQLVKKLLNNGYILQCSTTRNMYEESNFFRNSDNESCYYPVSEKECDAHALTIVGYDDNICFDTNSDGSIQESEKGAFKIANSWGKDWRDGKDGFFWVQYNVLDYFVFKGSGILWFNVKCDYKPKLLAKVTLSTKNRNAVYLSLGYSSKESTTPLDEYRMKIFGKGTSATTDIISFDGDEFESERTFYFDYTDLINKNNLNNSGSYRWYIKVRGAVDNPVTVKEFSIVNPNNGNNEQVVYNGNKISTGEDIILYGDCTLNSVTSNLPSTIPGTPINFKAKSNYNEVSLTWEPDSGKSAMPLYYRLEVDGDWYNIMSVFDTKTSFKFPSNSAHKFRIAAVNQYGVSNWSDPLEISTLDSGLSVLENMKTSRNGHGSVYFNGKIYTAGGFNSNGYLSSLEEYDPDNNSWTIKENMSQGKRDICMVSADGKIYVIGGFDGNNYLNTMEIYDPNSANTNKWSVSEKPMPNRRGDASAVVIGNKIYVVGGKNKDGVLNTIDVYDIQNKIWSTIYYALETPRYGFAAAAVNNKIYIFGGTTIEDGVTYNLNSIEVFDATQKTSSIQRVFLKSAKSGLSAAVVGNKIYIAGGTGTKDIEEYDTTACKIVMKSSTPTEMESLSSVSINEKVYFIGGSNGSSYMNECLKYEPLLGCTVYKAANPSGRTSANAIEYNGKIYTAGLSGQISNPFDVYDPIKNTWSTPDIPPMNEKREGFGLASANGYIYAFGGSDGTPMRSITRYDPTLKKWEFAGNLLLPHNRPVCVTLNGYIYIIGALNAGGRKIERYNPVTFEVESEKYKNIVIEGIEISAAVIANKIYICADRSIYEFRPDTAEFIDLKFDNERFDYYRIAAIGELLYIFGGRDSSDIRMAKNCSDIIVYSPLEKSFKTIRGALYNGYGSQYSAIPYNGSIYFFGEIYSYTYDTMPDTIYQKDKKIPQNTLEFKPNSFYPSNLVTTVSKNTIKLAWDAVPNAISYYVDWDGLQYGVTNTTYNRTIENSTRLHSYRVRAATTEGSSVWGRKVTGKYIITGDLDFDNAVTQNDFNMLSQYLSNTRTLGNEELIAADVDNNGTVSTQDMTILGNFIKGIITTLPADYMRFAVYGDIDRNGLISMDDYDLLDKYLIGATTLTNIQKICADVDLNSQINADDYALLRQYLINKIEELPVR